MSPLSYTGSVRRPLKILTRSLLILFVAGYGLLLLFNGAPNPPPAPAPSAGVEMKLPFVVKVHARWCPVCMATKPAWTKLQKSFRERVRFVVFDVTSESSKAKSRAESVSLGLEQFFESHSGRLGSVFVLSGESKQVLATLDGLHGYATYAAAIEDALNSPSTTALNDLHSMPADPRPKSFVFENQAGGVLCVLGASVVSKSLR